MDILPHLKLLRRPAGAAAVVALAVTGVAVSNVVTRPASNGSEPVVQLAQPVADGETTTTTGPDATAVLEAAGRAEQAAGRAETAAGRAEVAATRAETVVTSTSTTSAPVVMSGPVVTQDTADPAVETTTTTVPKRWVVIASFPYGPKTMAAPLTATVELQTGMVRATITPMVKASSGTPLVWFSDDQPYPVRGSDPPTAENTGTFIYNPQVPGNGYPENGLTGWPGPWPTGTHQITAGSMISGDWFAPYDTYGGTGQILIEEYR